MAPKAKPGASPPPPRRKSCGECVKAKRRCDLLTPKCTRCFQKTLDCRYVREPRAQPNAASQGPAGQLVRRRPAVQAPFEAEIPSVVDPRQLKRLDPSPATSPEAGAELFVMANSFWNESIPRPPSTTNWLTPAPPTNSQIVYQSEDYNKMNAICQKYSQEQLEDSSTRIACAVAALKEYHHSMAFKFSTSFLHPKLYAHVRPKAITDVFSSCVMYACKTPRTESHVRSIIEENVSNLVRDHSMQQSPPGTALIRVQALLLYQTIRVFDGDIRLRANADKHMDMLHNWNKHLADLRDDSNDVQLSPTGSLEVQTPESWQSWVFAESIRRTIIMVNYFTHVYMLLKDGGCSVREWSKIHPWTLSKQLWQAPSSYEFFREWNKKKHYMMSNVFFEDFIKEGSGDQVDEFAFVLLTTYMGLDETREWIDRTKAIDAPPPTHFSWNQPHFPLPN